MTKEQLLEKLKIELSRLPKDELESRLAFYGEMIDDRIEDGLSEEDAVAAIGDIDEIISQLRSDSVSANKSISEDTLDDAQEQDEKPQVREKRRLGVWAIILICLGSPIWISLGAAAFSIIITVYAVIWAVAGSLWSLPISLAGVFIGGTALAAVNIIQGNLIMGITLIGGAVACAGLAIFAGFGCFHLTRLAAFLSRVIGRFIIRLFRRKENRNA